MYIFCTEHLKKVKIIQDPKPNDQIIFESIKAVANSLENNLFIKALEGQRIFPLYKFRNIRKKYKKGIFTIDVDKAIFDDFIYETCEIELIALEEKDIDTTIKKIEDFALSHGIKISQVEGRLIEYIRRKNPSHYMRLKNRQEERVNTTSF